MAQTLLALCPPQKEATVAELVEDHLSLVGRLVVERLARVPSHVRRDDLASAAMMALVVSAQAYDPSRGVPFAGFAITRIRGALTDELRTMDWASRSVRCRAREVESVRGQLACTLDRAPSTDEIAGAMQVDPRELESLQSDLTRANVLSLQGFAPGTGPELTPDPTDGPEALLLMRERLGYLHDAIAELPSRLRFVVEEYFFEQRQMNDIAEELGVTESRVSQICAEALCLLRDGMNSQLEPSAVEERAQSARAAANKAAYFQAIAGRSTLAGRLALSTPRGEMRIAAFGDAALTA